MRYAGGVEIGAARQHGSRCTREDSQRFTESGWPGVAGHGLYAATNFCRSAAKSELKIASGLACASACTTGPAERLLPTLSGRSPELR